MIGHRRVLHRSFHVLLATAMLSGNLANAGGIPPHDGDPLVRFAYVIPSNRTPQPNGVANYRETVQIAHAWYGAQMWRWGFGYKSFRYETEDDGITPLIHVVNVPETDEYLRGDGGGYDLWGTTWQALAAAGVPVSQVGEVWVAIAEAHLQASDGSVIGTACLGGGGALWGSGGGDRNGKAMIGADFLALTGMSTLQDNTPYQGLIIPEIGPYPLRYGVTWAGFLGSTKSNIASCAVGALAHEMGHAFGLYHDFRNDANFRGTLMGNGLRGVRGWVFPEDYPEEVTRLSYGVAMTLNSLPYFTEFEPAALPMRSGPPVGEGAPPEAGRAAESPETGANATELRFGPTGDDTPPRLLPGAFPSKEDPSGGSDDRDDVWPTLMVHTWGAVDPIDGHLHIEFTASDDEGLAVALLRLRGNTIDELPLSGTYASETFVTPYRDRGVYEPGDSQEYQITVYDPSGNAACVTMYITPGTGFNYAPIPYVRTTPSSRVAPGETVVIDALETTDADHDAGALLVEWDLDGDGVFDTSPTTVKTLSTRFPAPGVQIISARVTDPDGAVSFSTPITFQVFVEDADCNENGVVDVDDILDGTSADCNENWIPDECEPDCNANGVADECDIRDGTSSDIDGNGVPDECDPDCNDNGLPDGYDVSSGTSADCNLNGIPDECDIVDGTVTDDDGDGVPDECEGPVRYVNADATPGGNGLFWASAYNDLQDALASAAASDGYVAEIWVAAGTYTPTGPGGDRAASFRLLNGVTLYGGFAGDEASLDQRDHRANVTTLSGDLNRDDGPGFEDNDENSYHVVIGSDCDETAGIDGFVIRGGNADESSFPHGWGAGMYTRAGRPTIANCTFAQNTADYLGGGLYTDGGAPSLVNCAFIGNVSGSSGGAVYSYRSDPTLVNCNFAANSTGDNGGALHVSRGNPTLVNCTFHGNSAERGGAVYCEYECVTTISNCVLWGDSATYGAEIALANGYHPSTLTVSYSDVRGGSAAAYVVAGCTLNWGAGNIDADPFLVDPDGADDDPTTWADNDYHLDQGSPCIDAGDPSFVPGSDERDIDGQLRVWDGNGDGERRIDMGSDEFAAHRLGDLDGDGDIDLSDLAALASNYGETVGMAYEDGDLDGDGDVDLSDLAALLSVYGSACQ